ncbi:MAG: ComEC/Rec2 family competence protein [Candidatus Paceibacterota bacterium]
MQKIVVERFILSTTFVGVCVGILGRELFHLDIVFALFVLLLLLSSTLGVYVLRTEILLRPLFVILVVFSTALVLGLTRSAQNEKEFQLLRYDEQNVVLYGKVVSEPEHRENYQVYVLKAHAFETERRCEMLNEKVLVRADMFENVSYGEIQKVSGYLTAPSPFITQNGRIFLYDEYLKKDGIGIIISFASIEVLTVGQGNVIQHTLLSIKSAYLKSIARFISDPSVSLLGGLTVGTKQSLGEGLENDFRTTGIIHIVVLSGYNVIIVAETIMRSLRPLPLRARLSASILAIGFFVILVGAGSTVVRAALMAVVALLVRASGRIAVGLQLLLLAGVSMLIANPTLLLHDPSFQLSFVATLGLILFSKPLENLFYWIRNRGFREITTATVSTQIAVFPLLMYLMGEISLVALPVNLLILPTVPAAMLLGFITGIVGLLPFVSVFLAPVFGALAFFVLSYELLVVNIFARIPFASIILPPFSLTHMFLCYAFIVFVFWKLGNACSTEFPKQ